MEYITTKEASAKWGISTSRITLLANEGRIPGAQRLGKSWLIPAAATKPTQLKPNHSKAAKNETENFSFPLYHFRPDWSHIKEAQLSMQQRSLLLAETAVMECRFSDAYSLLEPILHSPDDIVTEIACLWNVGFCCIALNKPKDFSRFFLRLQIRLSEDFPHRDNLTIILDTLKTYVDTVSSAVTSFTYSPNIHDQCLPIACVQMGYVQLSKEIMKLGTADTAMLELNLRLLQTNGLVLAVEMLHCHLLSIYYLRQNMREAERHAKSLVQLVYENKLYFPLVSYYSFIAPMLAPLLAQYPEEFQDHCRKMISQYNVNSTGFFSSISGSMFFSKITSEDFPYILGVLAGFTNAHIAEKLGISQQTVNRRIARVCEKLGVNNKKELKEYLQKYM